MKFYLSSYKFGNKQEYLKEWIKKHGSNIAFISNSKDAKEDNESKFEKINSDIKLLEEIGFKVTKLDLRDYFGEFNKLDEMLKKFNSVCLIGGNCFVLRKAIELSGFDRFINENLSNDGFLYIGYSAGICVLSPNMKGLDLVDEPVNIYNSDDVLYEGMNVLDYVPVPHYKSDHPESHLVDEVVEYFDKNSITYKTIKDGEVIIENIICK